MDVTEQTFDAEVVDRSHELPVVVDFWADWCGPCKALTPVLEQGVAERNGDLVLAKVDVDANPELARRFGIRGIPAVKAFRRGAVVAEFVGAPSPAAVSTFLDGRGAAEQGIEELRASGELPDGADALEAGDHERSLELLLEHVAAAGGEERDRLRELMVALFGDLGHEHPVTVRYRRLLATTLY